MSVLPRPRKRFGQHFLHDPHYIGRIVSAVAPAPGDRLVEIGPGRGAITVPLARSGAELCALEVDRDLAALLRERFAGMDNVTIVEADALEFDFAALGSDLRVVGNLPYNISTPLLFRLIGFRGHLRDLHFMLQKEVVDRMAAAPGTRAYGRLTVMLGCYMTVERLFDVPPGAFVPPPRVTSAVVRLRPRPQGEVRIADEALLSRLVTQAFSRRRKTLRNALKGMAAPEDLGAAGLDPGIRPEAVPVPAWVALANRLAAHGAAARASGPG
ncbi:MAG TPA: 16S rRNA (adenine(1518)-N(6)/adenine(1519)-N(6))-dimethyltransferase RsmA [Woeseiaceae bacterium]|nr:16S rRNA (adenine(1518)-N(6)/adenine(1519)-N(6))-dimethyltransferase RsmA [Woeseiaceae bacterium]